MSPTAIDGLARRFAPPTRRRLAGGLILLALFGGSELPPPTVAAAGRCRRPGRRCDRDGQCCSGVCKRRKCRTAPGQSICARSDDSCRFGTIKDCGLGALQCICAVTIKGAPFCADRQVGLPCRDCANDGACQAEFGAGARCVACRSCGSATSRACAMPCSDPV